MREEWIAKRQPRATSLRFAGAGSAETVHLIRFDLQEGELGPWQSEEEQRTTGNAFTVLPHSDESFGTAADHIRASAKHPDDLKGISQPRQPIRTDLGKN
jgi:hypothetical protein